MADEEKKAAKIDPGRLNDADWGEVVSCVAVARDMATWPWRLGTCVPDPNPLAAEVNLRVKYENGAMVRICCRGFLPLAGCGLMGGEIEFAGGKPEIRFGEVVNERSAKTHTKENASGQFGNKRLVATVVNALASFEILRPGKVDILSSEEADRVFRDTGVSVDVLVADDSVVNAAEQAWLAKWRASGDVVEFASSKMAALAKAHGLITEARGEPVALCDGRVVYGKELTEDDKMLIADPDYWGYVPPNEYMLETGWSEPVVI